MKVALQPASLKSKPVLLHYQDTIDSPVDVNQYRHSMNAEYDEPMDLHPSGRVAMWGVVPGKSNANVSKQQAPGQRLRLLLRRQASVPGRIHHAHLPQPGAGQAVVDRR